jgi:hypothetical protein
MRNTPIIGPVLNHPIVQKVSDAVAAAGRWSRRADSSSGD